ncbi:MAG: hypothetical protein NWS46_02530 [Cyclobacteriaceae bacterium]|jgi:hypothetical protein|nr:hypothetical protein [Cyclobacteriaceae bacterium]
MSVPKNSILNKKRDQLTAKESDFLEEIETKTSELNSILNKTLKRTLYVGGGLLAGYAVYKLLARNTKKIKLSNPEIKNNNTPKRTVFNPILSIVVEKGLSLLVDSLKSRIKK